MFELGILILILGVSLRIWTRLSSNHESRSIAPQRVSQRNVALKIIRTKKKNAYIDSTILIIMGIILVLVTAVFN